MSITIDMVVPPMGEAIEAARLVAWIVHPGQAFEVGNILVEIETDKSVIEVPAHESGVMLEHLVAVDGVINADTVIARIQVEGEVPVPTLPPEPVASSMTEAVELASEAELTTIALPMEGEPTKMRGSATHAMARQFVTPAARKMAAQQSIAVDAIEGSGPQGRVTLADINAAPSQTAVADTGRVLAKAAQAGKRDVFVATRHGDVHVSLWSPFEETRETFVLVHGMFGDTDTWAGLAHTLSHGGARVVAMDLPCHGKTRSQVTKFGDIVDTVADVIGSQCQGPITLVGHSFGGAVAARVMKRPGIIVQQLFMIAPVGLGTEIEQSFLNGMSNAANSEALERELQKLTASGMLPSSSFIDGLRRSLHTRQESVMQLCNEVSRNGVQQLNIKPDLLQASCKCTIMHGRLDTIIPWHHALNAPPHVALHLVPDAGHMPQWESGKLVASIVQRSDCLLH